MNALSTGTEVHPDDVSGAERSRERSLVMG